MSKADEKNAGFYLDCIMHQTKTLEAIAKRFEWPQDMAVPEEMHCHLLARTNDALGRIADALERIADKMESAR